MKNKLSVDLLRWVGLPLLLAGLLAWAVAPAYTGDTGGAGYPVLKPTEKNVAAKTARDTDVQELNGRLKELEDTTRQNYMLELDGQRKQVEWLLTFLGIMVGIIALFGTLFPFMIARKNKEIIEQDITQIKQLLADAKSSVDKIHQHEAEAASRNEKMKGHQEGHAAPETLKAAREAIDDKYSDPVIRLRAEAIFAGQSRDANKSYMLWAALAELAPSDVGAQFNAGYWAGILSENHLAAEKLHWLKLAQHHSALALSLKPDNHDAANNWGNALAAEAEALASTKPEVARALWKQTGEKYQLMLSLKPDSHEAANNWGNALAAEAEALASTQPHVARALWKQAGEKYQLALSLKPDKHKAANNWGDALAAEASAISADNREYSKQLLDQAKQLLLAHADAAPEKVSYNLACVYGMRRDVKNCLKWLKVCQAHKVLMSCEYMRMDKGLDSVRDTPEFVEWFKQVCP